MCGDIHLAARLAEDDPTALVLEDLGHQVRSRLRSSLGTADRMILAAGAVALAYDAVQSHPEEAALRPVADAMLNEVLREAQKNPASFLQLLSGPVAAEVSDERWLSYRNLLAARVQGEDGSHRGIGDAMVMEVRGQAVRVGRGGVPQDGDVGGWHAVATANAFPAWLRQATAVGRPVVVRLDPVHPSVVPLAAMPGWLVRLLDPRPDPELVGELRRVLHDLLLTEPFITLEEHGSDWPRTIVRAAFAEIANEGRARLRDVPGVGWTLVVG
jgi:hypothetical protein